MAFMNLTFLPWKVPLITAPKDTMASRVALSVVAATYSHGDQGSLVVTTCKEMEDAAHAMAA